MASPSLWLPWLFTGLPDPTPTLIYLHLGKNKIWDPKLRPSRIQKLRLSCTSMEAVTFKFKFYSCRSSRWKLGWMECYVAFNLSKTRFCFQKYFYILNDFQFILNSNQNDFSFFAWTYPSCIKNPDAVCNSLSLLNNKHKCTLEECPSPFKTSNFLFEKR